MYAVDWRMMGGFDLNAGSNFTDCPAVESVDFVVCFCSIFRGFWPLFVRRINALFIHKISGT